MDNSLPSLGLSPSPERKVVVGLGIVPLSQSTTFILTGQILAQVSTKAFKNREKMGLDTDLGLCYTKILSLSCDKTLNIPTCPES